MKLTIKNLSKKYGDFYALDNMNAEFIEGIYGLLGPNGAGKTTFMNLLTDNLQRTSGEILFDGKDILELGKKFRAMIGYMPQVQGFYEQFSPMEFLKYIGKLKGLNNTVLNSQIKELLTKVNLYEHRHEPMGSFSGGMCQRVLLAQAFLGNPKVIIMDEPTSGLDPEERINLRNIIADNSKDKIIFIATHIVSDIECIAEKVLLLRKGQLVKMETPQELITGICKEIDNINKNDELSLEDVYMFYLGKNSQY